MVTHTNQKPVHPCQTNTTIGPLIMQIANRANCPGDGSLSALCTYVRGAVVQGSIRELMQWHLGNERGIEQLEQKCIEH